MAGDSERTSPLPGLALGCEPAEVKFQPWERRERRDLKSMFSWKVKPQQHPTKPKPVNDGKDKKSNKCAATEPKKVENTRQESIHCTVLKILTRGRRSGFKRKQEEVCEKREGWRGPRPQPSEIPVQRQINKRTAQVSSTV